jgi:UPF0755 protein
MKKFLRTLLFLFIILAIICGVGFFIGREWYTKTISTPNSSSSEKVRFEIEKGQSADVIAKNLKDQNLIQNADAFFWYVRLNELAPKIQAGTFVLSKDMSIIQIVDALQNASADTVWVTVQEGLRMDEIGDIYEKAYKNIEGAKFSRTEFDSMVENPDKFTFSTDVQIFLDKNKPDGKPLEGFLYPETYNFEKIATTKTIVEKMISTLMSKISADDLDVIESSDYNYYETLTLASLIERESFAKDEKPMIADILIRRLEGKLDGTKLLNVDATLLYEVKDWKANAFLYKNDNSPYNTYKFPGLPPTPICNPSTDSIKAVAHPTKNDYFYYLHDDEGKIHYAKTLSEHNANKAKYID